MARNDAADLVLTGGRVWTSDPARSWAEAIAVAGGRVLAVGSANAIRPFVDPDTRLIELRGRMVVPGFGDAHVHPIMAGVGSMRCNLLDARGKPAYLEIISSYLADHPDLEWIEGEGWYMPDFLGGTPRRDDLDPVTGDRPALLWNRDGHGAWVNTAALAKAGITADTADPPDGRIERDPDGSPSGTLHEGAAGLVADLIPPPTHEERVTGLREAQAYLHSLGITNWQDAHIEPDDANAYRALVESGELTARVVGSLWWERTRGVDQVEELIQRRSRESVGGFIASSVKIMQDGVLENFTGGMIEPYLDADGQPTDNRGKSFVEPELLKEAVAALDAAGFQVHFHAIGDRAVREALDAVEAARVRNRPRDGRHHISHIQVIHPDDIPRFRALDVVANAQPLWACREPQMEELTIPFLGPERTSWQYPFRSLRRAGAVLAMGSDWNVSTPDPMAQIEVAVERVWPASRGLMQPFLPEERLDLPDALAAFTAGTAYVNHLDEAGVLAADRLADLAVLDRDLFDPGAGPIGDARVVATFVGGQAVYEDAALDG
jgi:predicted amidohydrolase YtcJ